jgi:hypothetical protein
MSKKKQSSPGLKQLELAQYQAEQAKTRFNSTMGALQHRLKPGTLAGHAWGGVREKSTEMADDALEAVHGLTDGAFQAVKDRPAAAYGIGAGLLLFLARRPLWRGASRLFSRSAEDENVIVADLGSHEKLDLTAPVVERSSNEGVNA